MIPKNIIRHFINGQDLGEPRNWEGLVINVDWINRQEGVNINITDLEFVLEANSYLQERILNGTSGGVGIFEGEPYELRVGDQNDPQYVFEGYLDFTDDVTVLGQEEVIVGLKKVQGTDWINEVADSFSFAFLQDQFIITTSDFIKVPYVINYVPDGTQVILLSLSLYLMTKETIENVEKLAIRIGELAKAGSPIDVTGLAGPFPVVAKDIGNLIVEVAKVAAQIAYIIAITAAIINLIEEIFEQLLPKKRFHLGMTFRRMFEKACQYLQLEFQSSIPELDWVHVPSKNIRGGESGETGVPTNGNAIYTFGDLIRNMQEMFNADYRIANGIFRFERRDQFETPGDYIVPAFFNDQDRLLNTNGFNTDELIANYTIIYQLDTQDQNTLDDASGRVFQAVTEPINVINQKLVNMKGLAEIQLPFSLGKRKDDLTDIEKIAKSLGKFVDKLTGIFGKGTNFESKIERRIGSMLLSSDFLTLGRIVVMSGSQLARDQRAILSATNLWFNYHFINSFAEVNGVHNQYFRYQNLRVPMNIEDFEKVLNNDRCTDADGNEAKIETVAYEPQNGVAVINYRIKKKYTNNLKITYV